MRGFEHAAKDFYSVLAPLYYRKRKVTIEAAESVTLCDLNWSDGTRSEYRAFAIVDGRELGSTLKYSAMHPSDNQAEGQTLPIPAGSIVVRTGYFCGRESMATIYVNPVDMPRLLPGAI